MKRYTFHVLVMSRRPQQNIKEAFRSHLITNTNNCSV
uniref:Uncharacterized protein n=1 Tax=Anguilla anguilla TaxID=7936 RepID=A0A0E9PBA7_ANGAN